MCTGTLSNGDPCNKPVKCDGACLFHYVNPLQNDKSTGKFKLCPCPEHKLTESTYMAEFVPLTDFMKKIKDETNLFKNCHFCRDFINIERKEKRDVRLDIAGQVNIAYFPPVTRKMPLYSEVVKCFESLGYVIQINEEEYLKLKDTKSIPAMCPLKHGIVKVNICQLKQGAGFCMQCGYEKRKRTNLEKTGYENPAQNPEVQEKMKTTYLERTGYENASQNPEVLEKRKVAYFEKTGYENPMQNPKVQEKMKSTYFEKTGYEYSAQNPAVIEKRKINYLIKSDGKYEHQSQDVEVQERARKKYLEKTNGKYEYALQNPEVREKIKQTNLKRIGYEYYLKDPEFRAAIQKAYFEKTGYSNPFQNPEVKEKIKQTNLKNTGFPHPMQNPETKQKVANTILKNTEGLYTHHMKDPEFIEKRRMKYLEKSAGMYDNPMQDPQIFDKIAKSMYKRRVYIYPFGKETLVQGYENFCLDDLIENEGLDETEICNQFELKDGVQEMPVIPYIFGEKDRRYYPDIYIPSQNKIIEVKSSYTYERDEEKNIAKGRACMDEGYIFELRIYDEEGNYSIKNV